MNETLESALEAIKQAEQELLQRGDLKPGARMLARDILSRTRQGVIAALKHCLNGANGQPVGAP